jgi:hypothetical protein
VLVDPDTIETDNKAFELPRGQFAALQSPLPASYTAWWQTNANPNPSHAVYTSATQLLTQ